jgi:thioredoxin-like negative regulator of GroEL
VSIVRRTAAVVLLASTVLLPLACGPAGTGGGAPATRPAVFDTRPYAEAKVAAESEGRLLVVKATADWCPPCKQMDATTWRDEKVVAWFKDNGIAVAVDVDRETATAKELGVEAMPTMIAFKGGREVGRRVGYMSAADLLAWTGGLAKAE